MVTGLEVHGLSVLAPNGARLLDGASFALAAGERKGLIGVSGSGKSLTAAALCGLLRPPLRLQAEVMHVRRARPAAARARRLARACVAARYSRSFKAPAPR